MRVVCCIPVTISQLTTFGPWNFVGSMFHTSGISLVTSTTATNNVSLWIRNSGLTASECGTSYYYDRASGKVQNDNQSDEWNLQTSTGDW